MKKIKHIFVLNFVSLYLIIVETLRSATSPIIILVVKTIC